MKTLIKVSLVVIGLTAMTSCSGNKTSETTETDSTAVEQDGTTVDSTAIEAPADTTAAAADTTATDTTAAH